GREAPTGVASACSEKKVESPGGLHRRRHMALVSRNKRVRVLLLVSMALTLGPQETRARSPEPERHPQRLSATVATRPNIVLMLTDNLGYGELGVYGGGILRGAP